MPSLRLGSPPISSHAELLRRQPLARPVTIHGVTFPGRIGWEARFAKLLAADDRGELEPEVHDAIAAIAAGAAPTLHDDSQMTAWTWITLRNLRAYVRAGARVLRRCRSCDRWLLSGDPRRVLCGRRACHQADMRKRAARAWEIERERRRGALRQVVRRGTR